MKRTILAFALALFSISLQGCSLWGGSSSAFSNWDSPWYTTDGYTGYKKPVYPKRPIVVNPGYHMADGASPMRHKDRDRNWIDRQASSNYTIQVDQSESAARVAKKLHKSPKLGRAAQFKHRKNNKTTYTGVLGSYQSREEAQKALERLPASVRQGAKVQSWGNVQYEASQQPVEAKPVEAVDGE